jgi:hypothetical protein
MNEVRGSLHKLELKYGITTGELIRSTEEHGAIPEDVVAYWLFLVEREDAISESNQILHENYLRSVKDEVPGADDRQTAMNCLAA